MYVSTYLLLGSNMFDIFFLGPHWGSAVLGDVINL